MRTVSRLGSSALIGFISSSIAGCTVGTIRDTDNIALADVDVVAYGSCGGAGCEANRVETESPTGPLIGYKRASNEGGHFFFDPYAKQVPAQDAMAIGVPAGSSANYYKLQVSKAGFQDVWRDYTPEFKQYQHEGDKYFIAAVPQTYMCREGDVDTDGDGICDAAEARYGTSALSADTNQDGIYDDQELFGTGSPFEVSTRKILRYSLNVSDMEASQAFYARLGFELSAESAIDESDPERAQGLGLAPYQANATVMVLDDGFVLELMRFTEPYDPAPPHAGNGLGLNGLTLHTENLSADRALLDAAGIGYTVISQLDGAPSAIRLTDPDGVGVLVVQKSGSVSSGAQYGRSAAGPTIAVTDYEASVAFYQKLGFRLNERPGAADTLSLGNSREVTLEERSSGVPSYENANHLGLARFSIETTNIEQDISVLSAKGISFYTPPISQGAPFEELRTVAFEDPDGTIIELVQYNWEERPALLGRGTGEGRETLPLGEMCDGSPEGFYGERLFEPVLCDIVGLPIPIPRLEAPPRHDALYVSQRCSTPLIFQTPEERFQCGRVEFFLALQDGRRAERDHSMGYISKVIDLSEGDPLMMTEEHRQELSRMYEYRAIGKNGMGLENGVFEYLVFPELHAGADFLRTEELEPGNIPAIAFGLSNDLTSARIAGDEELAIAKAWDILLFAETAGDPETLEPLNVGIILTLMGIVADFPMSTGLPQRMLDDFLWAMTFDGELDYFTENTQKAPFIRPGLEYALASLYARNSRREEYIAQLEVVAQQPRYEEWAWYDLVEAQRADPDRMLAKFEAFGDELYSDTYAGSNNGCMFCHGNQ